MGRSRGAPSLRLAGGAGPGRDTPASHGGAARDSRPLLDALRPGPLGPAHRRAGARGDRRVFRRDPGAGLAHLAPLRPAPVRRHPCDGCGTGRLHAHARICGHASIKRATLYRQGYAHLIMLTGSKEPGDRCTEAQSGAMYLETEGGAGERHSRGRRERQLREHPGRRADPQGPRRDHRARDHRSVPRGPVHGHRLEPVATPSPTPTQTSPIAGWSTVPYFVKETIGVGLGRIIGFNHLEWLHDT